MTNLKPTRHTEQSEVSQEHGIKAKIKTKKKLMNEKQGFVYIITNQYNTTLYIGVTSDLIKRIFEHKNKVVDGFSKTYNLDKLVYFEQCDYITGAIEREKYLKGKKRQFKINLINNKNPQWHDLYPQLINGYTQSP